MALIDYVAVLGPLLWWGGAAALARVLADTGGTPGVGDLWATVPFVFIGLLLVAVTALRFAHRRFLMWAAFALMLMISVGVWTWHWGGWSFYLTTAVFVFMVQLLAIRAVRIRSGERAA